VHDSALPSPSEDAQERRSGLRAEQSLPRIRKRSALRVGITPDLPGFAWRPEPGAPAVGLEIDLAHFLADGIFGAGCTDVIDFVDLPITDQEAALLDDEVDVVIANFAITEARQRNVAFVEPYMMSSHAPLVRHDAPPVARDTELNGLRVGVNKGTTDLDSLLQVAPRADAIEIDGAHQCLRALVDRSIDAYWSTTAANIGFLENMAGSLREEPVRHGLEHWAIAVAKHETELQSFASQRLLEMFATGRYARSVDRWVGLTNLDLATR